MQTRSRCGDRSARTWIGKNRLVALAILKRVRTCDVRWQRHVADALYTLEKIGHRRKEQGAFAEFAPLQHLSFKIIVLAKKQSLADADLASRSHESLPQKWLALLREQNFNLAAKKILCRRVPRAHPLGLRSRAPREEPRWENACIVEDEQIAISQQRGKIAKATVFESPSLALEAQHARSGAVGERLL